MNPSPSTESGDRVFRGIGVSPGVAYGPAHLAANVAPRVDVRRIAESEIEHEVLRLEDALILTRRQIRALQKDIEARASSRDASVLDAHLMVLDDRMFIERVIEAIRADRQNVEAAVRDSAEAYAAMLSAVQDDYLRERVSDVRDVARRLLLNLTCERPSGGPSDGVEHRHIVVASDLSPSDTAAMRKDRVLGFATDLGSPTSHSAVMARALEIPAVVGLHDVSRRVRPNDIVLVDGNKGVLILNPTPKELEEYGRHARARMDIEEGLRRLAKQPAETKDGRRVVLAANAEQVEEIESILRHGAEGVGLFRSEYLFLAQGGLVDEEAQYAVYAEVTRRLKPAAVTIRTLDIGGDKCLPQAELRRESNPFMGCRSIRFSLQYPDVFKAQLRAVLRAGAEGNVKIMYPMISNVGEVLRANELLAECKDELRAAGQPFDDKMKTGIMIETPGAALTADILAQHVDFFSIGTNDLVQYTLAVDRVNENVAYLYEPTHPAVLKLIRFAITAAHEHGIPVAVCGEMGADPLMTPLLVGMGVDELSVAPAAVPMVKDAIRSLTFARAKELAAKALTSPTGTDVLRLCRAFVRESAPELLELI